MLRAWVLVWAVLLGHGFEMDEVEVVANVLFRRRSPSPTTVVLARLADQRLLHPISSLCLGVAADLPCAAGPFAGEALALVPCDAAPAWRLQGGEGGLQLFTDPNATVYLAERPQGAGLTYSVADGPEAMGTLDASPNALPPHHWYQWWRPRPTSQAPAGASPAMAFRESCPADYRLSDVPQECHAACGCSTKRRPVPRCQFCCAFDAQHARCHREYPFSCPAGYVVAGPDTPRACRRQCPPGVCCRMAPDGRCHTAPHVHHHVALTWTLPLFVFHSTNYTLAWESQWLEGPLTASLVPAGANATAAPPPGLALRRALPPSGSVEVHVPATLPAGDSYRLQLTAAAYPHATVFTASPTATTVLPDWPHFCVVPAAEAEGPAAVLFTAAVDGADGDPDPAVLPIVYEDLALIASALGLRANQTAVRVVELLDECGGRDDCLLERLGRWAEQLFFDGAASDLALRRVAEWLCPRLPPTSALGPSLCPRPIGGPDPGGEPAALFVPPGDLRQAARNAEAVLRRYSEGLQWAHLQAAAEYEAAAVRSGEALLAGTFAAVQALDRETEALAGLQIEQFAAMAQACAAALRRTWQVVGVSAVQLALTTAASASTALASLAALGTTLQAVVRKPTGGSRRVTEDDINAFLHHTAVLLATAQASADRVAGPQAQLRAAQEAVARLGRLRAHFAAWRAVTLVTGARPPPAEADVEALGAIQEQLVDTAWLDRDFLVFEELVRTEGLADRGFRRDWALLSAAAKQRLQLQAQWYAEYLRLRPHRLARDVLRTAVAAPSPRGPQASGEAAVVLQRVMLRQAVESLQTLATALEWAGLAPVPRPTLLQAGPGDLQRMAANYAERLAGLRAAEFRHGRGASFVEFLVYRTEATEESFRRLLAGQPTTFDAPAPATPQYDRLQLWRGAFPVVTLATRYAPSSPLVVDTRVTHGNFSQFFAADQRRWWRFAHVQRSVLYAVQYGPTPQLMTCPAPAAPEDATLGLSPYGAWQVQLLQCGDLHRYQPYALVFQFHITYQEAGGGRCLFDGAQRLRPPVDPGGPDPAALLCGPALPYLPPPWREAELWCRGAD